MSDDRAPLSGPGDTCFECMATGMPPAPAVETNREGTCFRWLRLCRRHSDEMEMLRSEFLAKADRFIAELTAAGDCT